MHDITRSAFDDVTLEGLRRRRSSKWTHYPPDVIPAWVAEMDFPVAEPVRLAVIEAAERDDFGYAPWTEDSGLREVMAGWADRTYGWKVDRDRVLILPDVVKALLAGLLALTEPGDGVVIQPPVYPPFFSVVKEIDRTLIENPLVENGSRYEIDLDGLDAALGRAKAFVLCNPQNPTGRAFTRSELEAMAELALRHNVPVISDEVHSPLTLPGCTHTVFATLSAEVAAHTLTVTAASKAWNFGGLKCGFAVAGTPEMAERLSGLGHSRLSGVSIAGVLATEAALTEGEPWMNDVRAYLDGNRRLLADLLADRMPGVKAAWPEATYLAWLDCRSLDLPPDPHTFFLEQAKVALSNGPTFGTQGQGFVRLNFATTRAILTEIVDRMASAAGTG